MSRSTYTDGIISSPYSFYLVAEDTFGDNEFWFDGVATRALFQVEGTPKYLLYSGVTLIATGSPSGTAMVIFRIIFNGLSSSLLKDSVSQGTGNAGTGGMNGISLASNVVGSANMNVDISEMLIYDSVLSEENKASVMEYLEEKYSL